MDDILKTTAVVVGYVVLGVLALIAALYAIAAVCGGLSMQDATTAPGELKAKTSLNNSLFVAGQRLGDISSNRRLGFGSAMSGATNSATTAQQRGRAAVYGIAA